MGQCFQPKPGAPPYIIVRTSDVFDAVKNKWSQLGGPDSQCPSPRYGERGSDQNNRCRALAGAAWDNFDKNFPDTPTVGPYNSIVDAVPIEEVCQMKVFGDPENRIGPPPNLFENPGALGQQLQKWFLEGQADIYCEPCPRDPMEGACYCWPYFVTIIAKTRSRADEPWQEFESTSAAWGPIYGTGVRLSINEDTGQRGFNIYVNGQSNPGGVFGGRFDTCEVGRQEYQNSGGSGYSQAEIISVGPITPFSVADCEFYYGYAPAGGGPTSTACPLPSREPPLNNYPNTRPFYVPLPVPKLVFPAPEGCPSPEDIMNFTVNYIESPGVPGAAGEQGPPGEDGDTVMRTPRKVANLRTLTTIDAGSGAYGVRYPLPPSVAYVNIEWNSQNLSRATNGPRVIFEAPLGQKQRREILCGNVYLVHQNSGAVVAPYIHSSADSMMIIVPDSYGKDLWDIQVRDTFDIGFSIQTLGVFYSTWKFTSTEDIPELDFQSETPF